MALRMILPVAMSLGFASPALADDISFSLSNMTGADLTEFYATPVGNENWEQNLLGMPSLAAGSASEVTIVNAQGCDYDLRMVFADGDVLEGASNICETTDYVIQ